MTFTTDTTFLPSRGEFDACANENCCGHGTCNPDTGYCEYNSGWGGDKCCSQTCQGIIMARGCAIEDAYDQNTNCQTQKKEICLSNQYCLVDADAPNGSCVTCATGEMLNPTKDGCIQACETGLEWDEDAENVVVQRLRRMSLIA